MKSEQLDYYIHDESDAFRLELSGSLSGDGAQSAYQAWHTALSVVGRRPVVVDITCLMEMDERGRALLNLWQSTGARIVTRSVEAWLLTESILNTPLPEPSVQKKSWRQRLFAASSSRAEKKARVSASTKVADTEFIGVPRFCPLECRLP